MKVYCEKCEHYDEVKEVCASPVDDWYSPMAKCYIPGKVKNKNNDCKDYKGKITK